MNENLMMQIHCVRWPALLSLLVVLTGCLGSSPPSEFYLLEPAGPSARAGIGETGGPTVAIDPVRIARYLDRPQIVTAQGKNAYKLDDFHRWAERLDENIARVLAQNLTTMIPADRVLIGAGARDRTQKIDYRVGLNVLEFHVLPDGQAVLTAQWNIRSGSETLIARNSSFRAMGSTSDYSRMVAALNECLDALSRAIAADVRGLHAAHLSSPRG